MLKHASTTTWFVLLVGPFLVVPVLFVSSANAAMVPYASCFERSAAAHNLSATLLKAVGATESNYNPNARSHANAHGVMQIQWPGTAKHLGVRRLAQLYSPCKNIELGARYLRELLDRYKGNERRALAAYNYGPGRIKARGILPRGARKYVATVERHRLALLGGGGRRPSKAAPDVPKKNPPKFKKNSNKQLVATFSSRIRANRYLKLLQRKIPRAGFQLEKSRFRGHALLLTSNPGALTLDDRTLLATLGWTG